jgi:hypothetical protein
MNKIEFVLKVAKSNGFRDKVTKEHLAFGTILKTEDSSRANDLVKRGLAELTGAEVVEPENTGGGKPETSVKINDTEYEVEAVKNALSAIGAGVNANAGVKGINNKLETLTEDQLNALVSELSK